MIEKLNVDNSINYDNYIMTKKETRRYYVVVGLSLWMLGYLFYLNVILATFMSLCAIPLKKYYVKKLIKQRREQLRFQFKDLLYSLGSSISAGRQMSEALLESQENLGFMYEDKEPIMQELIYISKSIKESRTTEELLLKDFAYRSGVEEIINFSGVYSTCRVTGADINLVISKAAQILTEKLAIDKEISTITAQKKIEAKIISTMPIVIIFFLNVVSPGYLDNVYHTIMGKIIMTIALVIMFISYAVMSKIMEVKV